MKKNNKKGFTLIELLAVIVILAILATAAFTLIMPSVNKNRAKTFLSNITSITDAYDNFVFEGNTPNTGTGTYASCKGTTVGNLISGGYLKITGSATGFVAVCSGQYYVSYKNSYYATTAGKLINVSKISVSDDGTPSNFDKVTSSSTVPTDFAPLES